MADIDVQRAAARRGMPPSTLIRDWARLALEGGGRSDAGLVVRIVGRDEMVALNERYRCRPGATNVLAFPFDPPPGTDDPGLLGDVVICADVVADEARAQGRTVRAHFAHLVVHGVLHLCGHDHHRHADALVMESLETRLLGRLGFADPYRDAGGRNRS